MRILFVVNVDWFFLSHRLALARAARDAGFDVHVATADSGRSEDIRSAGFAFAPFNMSRRGLNPVREIGTILSLTKLYRRVRPDLVHHFTPKPVLYGSAAARLVRDVAVVNTVTGLGYVFSRRTAARLMRPAVAGMYRFALGSPRVRTIFQNSEDLGDFVRRGLVPREHATFIPGSGVNPDLFAPGPEPAGPITIVLPARMLFSKGVSEFVEAARRLRPHGFRFALVGEPDPGNPDAVPVALLREWSASGVIEWWGRREDMPQVLAAAHIVVLPTTYPEGVPRSLIEAAAAGLPVVATDVPGCREIVRDGVNGFLIPPRDVDALASSIERLAYSSSLRQRMGEAGRALVCEGFTERHVIGATLRVYEEALGAVRNGAAKA